MATAGGVNRDLYSADVTIFRRKAASEVEPISIDLDAVVAGATVDPQIEADDVILVPINGFKYAYHPYSWTDYLGGELRSQVAAAKVLAEDIRNGASGIKPSVPHHHEKSSSNASNVSAPATSKSVCTLS